MATPRTLFAYKQLNANSRNWSEGAHKLSGHKRFGFWKKLGIIFLLLLFIGIVVVSIWMQLHVFKNLPDVSKVKDMEFSQATIIQDRNGVELYKFFDENREYVEIDNISDNMINAIVAMEDQNYWEHEGLDPWGIFRAALKGKGGASTLPQQLMTNVFKLKAGLTSKNKSKIGYYTDKVAYKLRQIVLAKRLNSTLQKQVKAENPNLSNNEAKKEMKRKVLELYLNYIEFGNNSFGVEAAAKSFFGVSAKDLDIAQSAILASLPKGPGQYSPSTDSGRQKLMGYFKITDAAGNEHNIESNGTLKQDIIAKFSDAIQKADFSNKKSGNSSVSLLQGLGSFNLVVDGKEYFVKFYNGRKDVVLSRMFEDDYITEEEYKQAEIESLTIEFKSATFSIKAPHFVFRIRELLEEKYGEDAVLEGGLVVKTTLDYNIQQMAEEALKNNRQTLYDNKASDSSLLYVNTDNGDILAYVGSLDYFDKDIQGQVDMVKSRRQSGSSIKPLIYALGFMKLPLTLDTPIYDIDFQVGPDKPNNADNKFEGMLPLKTALGHSRNIPAIKMFIAEGGESVVKPFLQSLGLPLDDNINYGYPLAIGAAEVSLLEFANAYRYLTTETPAEINPIMEITSADGSISYKKAENPVNDDDIIPAGVRYLIWKILSDPYNRLPGWVNKFNVAGLTYALKTGTSNMKTEKGNRPRDGLVAAYTPDNLILMWAGNADASPMNSNAYGGTIHAQPLKEFLGGLLKGGYITNTEMTNVDTTSVSICKITGKLPSNTTPSELIISSLGYSNNLPKESDGEVTTYEYDSACLGALSPMTPVSENKIGYFMNISSFMPNNDDLEKIKERRTERAKSAGEGGLNILVKAPEGYCENREPTISDSIKVTIIDPESNQKISAKPSIMYSIKSEAYLRSLIILVDGTQAFSKNYIRQTEDISASDIDLSNFAPGSHTITVQAMDINGNINSASITDVLESTDEEPPYLVTEQSKKQETEDGQYQITLVFDDHLSGIPGGSVSVNGSVINSFKGRLVSFTTSAEVFDVEVRDNYGNVLKKTIDIADL